MLVFHLAVRRERRPGLSMRGGRPGRCPPTSCVSMPNKWPSPVRKTCFVSALPNCLARTWDRHSFHKSALSQRGIRRVRAAGFIIPVGYASLLHQDCILAISKLGGWGQNQPLPWGMKRAPMRRSTISSTFPSTMPASFRPSSMHFSATSCRS